jgi:hypothetical protein
MRLTVDIRSTADATITVDIPEEDLCSLAEELGIAPQDIKLMDLADLIHERMSQPRLCVHCSGFGDSATSLALGDEWDIDKYDEKAAPEHRSIRIAE